MINFLKKQISLFKFNLAQNKRFKRLLSYHDFTN